MGGVIQSVECARRNEELTFGVAIIGTTRVHRVTEMLLSRFLPWQFHEDFMRSRVDAFIKFLSGAVENKQHFRIFFQKAERS